MKKRIVALLLGMAMVVSLLAACSGGSSEEETTTANEQTSAAEESTEDGVESKGTVKVGHLLDITGTEAITGAVAQKAFSFAVKYLEKTTGWTVEVVEGDCQSNSDKAATMAESMLSQGCVAIFGPTQIGHKKAVASYLADNGVPLILYNGTPVFFTTLSEWVIAEGGGTSPFPTVMADYIYNDLGIRNVYCFKQDTVGGNNYVDPFVTCFTAMGGTVVDGAATPVPQGTSDWSSYLTSMKNSGAEAIVGWTSSSDALAFYKEWYSSGAYETMPVYATMHGGFTDSYVMDELDEDIVAALIEDGLCAPINYAYSIDNEANKLLAEEWEAEFGEVPLGNNLPGAVYQALQLFLTALDSTNGDTDPTALRDAILAAEIDGPEGHLVFPADSTIGTKDVYVVNTVELDDGSYNYEVQKTYEQVPYLGYNYDGSAYTG